MLRITCKADIVVVKLGEKLGVAWQELWQQLSRGMSILSKFICHVWGLHLSVLV